MPGMRHEATVELFRKFPELLTLFLQRAAVPTPDRKPVGVDSDVSARRPLQLLSDNVFLVGEDDDEDKLVVVLEVQTDPPTTEKRRDWAAYLAIASHEHDREAVVVVIALSRETASSSRKSWRIGPGNISNVIVVGPDDIPGDPGRTIQLTMLAAISGALDLDREQDQVAVLDQISAAPLDDRPGYNRLILNLASDQARAQLEALMATTYRETLVDTLLAEGEAKGKAELLLRVLASREIEVPAKTRDLVTACADTTQLEAWFDLALTAETLSDVFGNQP